MGSTLTLCCFDNEGIIAAQIGDSSAYLYNTIEKKLISKLDFRFSINRILEALRLDEYEDDGVKSEGGFFSRLFK